MSKQYRLIIGFLAAFIQIALANQGGKDTFGHMWTDNNGTGPDTVHYEWIDANDGTVIFSGASVDDDIAALKLPFPFTFYGQQKDSLFVSSNGFISFKTLTSSYPVTSPIPSTGAPDSLIAAYWYDLRNGTAEGGVFSKVVGEAPNRRFIIEWEYHQGTSGFPDPINMEIVLYETSHLIKLQYSYVDAAYSGGRVGIEADGTDGISYNSALVANNLAVLFHNKTLGSAVAAISPVSSTTSQYETFTYRLYNVSTTPAGLGKVDYLAIQNPFADDANRPTVTSIKINSADAYIKNSADKPLNPGYASWQYDAVKDSLFIRVSHFNIIDSMVVVFGQTMPGTASSGNAYPSRYDAKLDSSALAAATSAGWSVDVTGSSPTVTHYTFQPANDTSMTAGGSLSYTITARDQSGTAVANSDSIILTTPGSTTAWFTEGTRLGFAGNSSVTVTVHDTIKGQFSIRAENKTNSGVNGESGLITVNPAAQDHFTISSASTADIEVGSERMLQVTLFDVYNNAISDSTVTFTRLSGNGGFSGSSAKNDTTDISGLAQALYTASTKISYGKDSVEVASGAVKDTIVMTLQAGQVSSYAFSPSGSQSIQAGGSVAYTITAKDRYGNGVVNSQTINLSTPGSSTAWFNGNITSIAFSNDSTVTVTVNDTTTGEFSVKAANATDSAVNGQSGAITVTAAAADHFTVTTASEDSLVVGAERLVQVYLYDLYSNPINNATVTFTRFQGSGLFSGGTNSANDQSDANGLAQASYTASTDVSYVTDRIEVVSGSIRDTVNIPLKTGALAELRIQRDATANGPAVGDTTMTADESASFIALGYDSYGNFKGRIASNWSGSGVVSALSPANPTDSVFFDATTKGSGTLKATAQSDASLSASTGLITVTAGTVASVLIRTSPNGEGTEIGDTTLTVGQTLYLYSAGYDADNNYNQDVAVDWYTTGTLTGLGTATNTSVTTLQPTTTGSGTVGTTSAYTDDVTGTITAQAGALASIRIQSVAGDGGAELVDYTGTAGSNATFYAEGYDANGIYLGPVNVTWTVDGDSIGYFSQSGSVSQNTFNFTLVNSSKFYITDGTFSDYSGVIKTQAGAAAALAQQPLSSDTLSAIVGNPVNDSLWVKVTDAYGNAVPGETVTWSTNTDGSLSPSSNQTDALGVARSKWTLRSTAGLDSAQASVSGLSSAVFFANALPDSADSLLYVSGDGQTGTVNSDAANPLRVRVVDYTGAAVSGITVTFSISGTNDLPEGGSDYTIYTPSSSTDANGYAQTMFKFGSKAGTYIVRAYNSQLINSPVTFTLTADPAAADSILIYAGDGQSGTVKTQLSNPVTVKVVDAYENGIANAVVQWTPADTSGAVSATNDTSHTDANGFASTNWTLRRQAGKDTLTVSSGSLTSVIFTATANADAAANVLVYSGNNATVAAGSDQVIEAQVTDQYGNAVEGSEVTFDPADRVSIRTAFTDASGVARSVYNSPTDQDSSVARGFVSGLSDTAKFKIYGVRYIDSSLNPVATQPGQTETFYAQVNNPGPSQLTLDQANTLFKFDDGTTTFSTALDSPAVLNANQIVTLKFAPQTVDAALSAGNYTPQIEFGGTGDLSGTLNTQENGLAVEPLQILSVEVLDPVSKQVAAGKTVQSIRMQVRNRSFYSVTVDSAALQFTPGQDVSQTPQAGNPTTIAADQVADFYFTADVAANAATGTVSVDGYIDGNINGKTVYDHNADQTDQFTIVQPTTLTYESFSPDTVSEQQNTAFTMDVTASGTFDIILNTDSTRLVFGSDSFLLDGPQTLYTGVTTTLSFAAKNLTIPAGRYNGLLYIYGEENGQTKQDTLDTGTKSDTLTVQTPAVLVIDSLLAAADTVSQNSDTLVNVYISNTGEATLELTSLTVSPYGTPQSITPALPVMIGGASQQVLSARVHIPSDATTGNTTLDATAQGTDVNSGDALSDNAADQPDSWYTAGKPLASVDSIRSTETIVTPGQTNIPVNIYLANSGETPISVTSVSLIPTIGLYTESPAAYPFELKGNSQTMVTHYLDVLNNSATGKDTLYAKVEYTNNYSGSDSTFVSTAYLAWKINVAGGSVKIISVNTDYEKVSHGQDSAIVDVRLKNETANDVTLDSLKLIFANGQDNYLQQLSSGTPLGVLAGNDENTYRFYVSVLNNAQTGQDSMHARLISIDSDGDTTLTEDQTINDRWLVQQRQQITVDSVRIDPAMASTGQSGLLGSVYISNAAGTYRADAQIDSVKLKLKIGAADYSGDFDISLQSSPSLGSVLKAGQSIRYNFDLTVHTDAGSATYQAVPEVKGHDVNDNRDTTVTTTASGSSLTVQQAAGLVVNSVWVVPDTLSQGQTHGRVMVDFSNPGEAAAVVNSALLSFSEPTIDFEPLLINKTTPFSLSGGLRDTLIFSINVNTTSFTGTVQVDATLDGEDANSAAALSASSASPASFVIETPADVKWVSTTPSSSKGDTTEQFYVTVSNSGQARVDLDESKTVLKIKSNDFTSTLYTINLHAASPKSIAGDNQQTVLRFEDTYLTGMSANDYRYVLELYGSSNGDQSYQNTLNAGILAYAVDVSITQVTVTPDEVVEGYVGVQSSMYVSNSEAPKTIDESGTTLIFKDKLGNIRTVNNLTRTDTLTILKKDITSELTFTFDIPEGFPIDTTYVYGQISLENGTLIKESSQPGAFVVNSAGNPVYISGSFSPDSVIHNQTVSFTMGFANTGTADLVLNQDSTYINIIGSGMTPINMSGGFTLHGKDRDTGVLDTTYISFVSTKINENVAYDAYDVLWHLNGQTPTGNVDNWEDTDPGALSVIPQADLVFANLVIDSAVVRAGQEDVSVKYQIKNNGASPAVITGFNFNFYNLDQSKDVSGEWALNNSTLLADTIQSGVTRIYPFRFNVSQQATTGRVIPTPAVRYFDVLLPDAPMISNTALAKDTVTVINPANIRIDSLIAEIPNPQNNYVNVGQPFDLRIVVSNTGADTIQSAEIWLRENNLHVATRQLNKIAPNSTMETLVQNRTLSVTGQTVFKAEIHSATDLTNKGVTPLQPLDNSEILLVQTPVNLRLSSSIVEPQGAADSVVSLGQEFVIRSEVENSGQASFGPGSLTLVAADYSGKFTPVQPFSGTQTISQSKPFAEWRLRADALTTGQLFDQLRILLSPVPVDSNTMQPPVSSLLDTVSVKVTEAADISADISVTDPPGARDLILSSGQTFIVQAIFHFNSSVDAANRLASIRLPDGYAVSDSSVIGLKPADTDTVLWNVVAPENPSGSVDSIFVLVSAVDKNSGIEYQKSSSKLGLTVQKRAQLDMNLKIVKDTGSQDNTMSEGQEFTLETKINQSEGTAPVQGGGRLILTLDNGLELTDGETAVKTFSDISETVSWRLRAGSVSFKAASAPAGVNAPVPASAVSGVAKADAKPAVEDRFALLMAAAGENGRLITVQIDSIPVDVNTNKEAFIANPQKTDTVFVENAAQITDLKTTLEKDTVSTGQTFSYGVNTDFSGKLVNAVATVSLPPGFGSPADTVFALDSQGNGVKRLTVPLSYNGSEKVPLKITVAGEDFYSGQVVIGSKTDTLVIERKAELALKLVQITPLSVANSGFASWGQEIQVMMKPVYATTSGTLSNAAITGQGSVTLNSEILDKGFEIIGAAEQAFSALDQTLAFRLRAPKDVDFTINLNFHFKQLPLDENDGLPALVAPDSGMVNIPLRVRQKTVEVIIRQDLVTDTSFTDVSGTKRLLAFDVSNKEYDDPLNVDGLVLSFYENGGQDGTEAVALDKFAVANIFKSIRIVDVNELERIEKASSPAGTAEYVNLPIDENIEVPLQIPFTQTSVHNAGEVKTYVVLGEFRGDAVNRSFWAQLSNVWTWDVADSILLQIVDEEGEKIQDSEMLVSKKLSLQTQAPENDFFNYPNPFGRQYKQTSIQFQLRNPSDVEFRIFTLLGELVKTWQFSGLSPGVYSNLIRWDGTNDRGKRVLNGVYIGIIDIKPSNGQPAQRYTTKMAYIK
ncbi:MAG TPA: hypothetical protein ENK44_13050 [Caldithrix abyssi]|uniref:Big-1 domain-containing protein n=1 Tax=Caldithrix abyssi TaxID=187145 RepID=A0A7V4WVW7_CALAY|nr:hypothetical protein [Caldithrix abyssi]